MKSKAAVIKNLDRTLNQLARVKPNDAVSTSELAGAKEEVRSGLALVKAEPANEPAPELLPVPELAPIPTPPPAPNPEPSQRPDIFSGARISDFHLVQAAKGAVTEVLDPAGSGQTVLALTVHDEDVEPITPTENPRAELLTPEELKTAEEFWLRTAFYIPTSFPSVPGWLTLISVYGKPFNGPAPWHIQINSDKLDWERNGTYGYDKPWSMALPKGRWVEILEHHLLASDGWVETWVDGTLITFFSGSSKATTKLEMKTLDSSNNSAPNYAKICQYRMKGMFEVGTIYFKPLLIGTTQASVEG